MRVEDSGMGFTKDTKGKTFLAGWSRRRAFFWGIVMVILLWLAASGADGQSSSLPFRIGFSRTTFGDIDENDIIASIRVWAQTLFRDRGIAMDPKPRIFKNVREISEALANKTIDCVTMGLNEYVQVSGQLARDRMVVGVVSDSIFVQFVLLVHRKGRIENLSDLRGRKIGLLASWRTTLAPFWLNTLLERKGLGLTGNFFHSIVKVDKITKAVLPVFFRQMDVCLVTRRGFKTMVELNPQVGQQLKVLAVSNAYVPGAFFFRADYTSPLRAKVMNALTRWHLDPAGRQILTIFKVDRLEQHSVDSLKSALKLLAEYNQLFEKTPNDSSKKRIGESAGRGK
jgi:ABC-type phosphate/phosphonate transport system substrate-binding protein